MTDCWYIGADPGAHGAVVALRGDEVSEVRIADGYDAVWLWLREFKEQRCKAVLEHITLRPTFIPKLGRSTLIASTGELYGSYLVLQTMLTTVLGIDTEVCPPKRWQEYLNIRKTKGEKDTVWKNRLKARAQELMPDVKMVLDTSDAYLLALYAMLKDNEHAVSTSTTGSTTN